MKYHWLAVEVFICLDRAEEELAWSFPSISVQD